MPAARVVYSGRAQRSQAVASIQKSCELVGKRKSSVPVLPIGRIDIALCPVCGDTMRVIPDIIDQDDIQTSSRPDYSLTNVVYIIYPQDCRAFSAYRILPD